MYFIVPDTARLRKGIELEDYKDVRLAFGQQMLLFPLLASDLLL